MILDNGSNKLNELFERNIKFFKENSNNDLIEDFDSFDVIFLYQVFPKLAFMFLVFLYAALNKNIEDLKEKNLGIETFKKEFFEVLDLEMMLSCSLVPMEGNSINKEFLEKEILIVTIKNYIIHIFETEISDIYLAPEGEKEKIQYQFLALNINFFANVVENLKTRKK